MAEREKKLFDPRNVEGKARSSEIVGKLRTLEYFLADYPEYVGVSTGGSFYKGYADFDKTSDVDFAILVDKSARDMKAAQYSSISHMQKQFVDQNPEFQFLGEVDLSEAKFIPGKIEGAEPAILLAMLEKVSGKKIINYRERARIWLKTLGSTERESVWNYIESRIRGREGNSMRKFVFRKLDSSFHHNDDEWTASGYQVKKEDVQNARDGLWIGIHSLAADIKFASDVDVEVEKRMRKWHKRIGEILDFAV